MSTEPFFDQAESCLDNPERAPFGIFAGTIPASQNSQFPKNQFKERAHEL